MFACILIWQVYYIVYEVYDIKLYRLKFKDQISDQMFWETLTAYLIIAGNLFPILFNLWTINRQLLMTWQNIYDTHNIVPEDICEIYKDTCVYICNYLM